MRDTRVPRNYRAVERFLYGTTLNDLQSDVLRRAADMDGDMTSGNRTSDNERLGAAVHRRLLK